MYSFLRKAFFLIPFLLLSVLLALAFFQHPGSDDFTVHYFVKSFGLREAIHSYLLHSTGRYVSVSLLLWVGSSRFVLDHYYILLQFFMLLTMVNSYCFVNWVASEFFQQKISISWRLWMTAFFILILLGSLPQVGSFFFWLSTDIGYLLPFNAFLCYLPLLFSIFEKEKERAFKPLWVLSLLSIIMAGSDEISMFYMLVASFSFCAYKVFSHKKLKKEQWLLITLQILLVGISFLFPGNKERGGGFVIRQSFVYSLAGSVYQTFQVLLSVFSNLFFWVGFVAILFSYSLLKEEVRQKIRSKKTSMTIELLVLISSALLLHFFARHIAGVVLPPRAKNLVACYLVLGLYTIALLNCPLFQSKSTELGSWMDARRDYISLFMVLLFVFNPFSMNLVQSVVMAPVHHRVLNARIDKIHEARGRGEDIVRFHSYNEDCQEVLEKTYGSKTGSFLHMEIPDPSPRVFWFSDDPASKINGLSYNFYYGIDTVMVGKDTSFSWRVAAIGPWGEKSN